MTTEPTAPVPTVPEDDYRFARRRAREGASDEQLVGELTARGVDAELAAQIAAAVRNESKRRLPGWPLWILAGGGLFALAGWFFFDSQMKRLFGAPPGIPWISVALVGVGVALIVKGLRG